VEVLPDTVGCGHVFTFLLQVQLLIRSFRETNDLDISKIYGSDQY